MPKHHVVKCLPRYFDAVADGSKPFEVRINDRDYQVDDTIELHCFDHNSSATPPLILRITYVLPGGISFGGQTLLAPNVVVMGIVPIDDDDSRTCPGPVREQRLELQEILGSIRDTIAIEFPMSRGVRERLITEIDEALTKSKVESRQIIMNAQGDGHNWRVCPCESCTFYRNQMEMS